MFAVQIVLTFTIFLYPTPSAAYDLVRVDVCNNSKEPEIDPPVIVPIDAESLSEPF